MEAYKKGNIKSKEGRGKSVEGKKRELSLIEYNKITVQARLSPG
jgi:hypothetical protein